MLKAGQILSQLGGVVKPWGNISRCASSFQPIIAIRREDNSVWERRAPLAPSHVRKLVKDGYKVIVQPSNRRAYPMQSYSNVGAHIQEDLSEATLIIGVKSVPIDLLSPNKTYAFFSHTIKAQEANMPMLDAILEKQIRLIDYERMVDANGTRVVAFGKYAGVAGMINILHGLGLRLLALGHHTPFMHIGPAHNYRNSEMAKQAIRDAGYEISLGLMPKSMGPLTFVFTGSGNVSQGAQEVFQGLPVEYVDVDHLPKVAKHGASNKVYACEVSRRDHLVRKEGGGYDKDEYHEFPERYASMFSIKIAPYASVIVNGIYFAPNAPRLISLPDAKNLLQPQKTPWLPSTAGCPHLPHRLIALCDISADPGGSIEFMQECTTIDSPFCLYDAESNMNKDSFAGDGVMICSIDNMPTQIPRESTDFFGGLLLPHIKDLLVSDATQPFEQYGASPVVKNAVITSNGVLTPNFQYINDLRRANRKDTPRDSQDALLAAKQSSKNVLILGAGYVSAPCVDYLTRDGDTAVTVASEYKHEVDDLASQFDNVTPVTLEIHRSQEELEALIAQHNVVISLLPYGLHPEIAKLCIKHKTNMVTASYRTPQMQELAQEMKDAGITVVNEVGVDPGIDHMLAMQVFDEVKEHGGKVTSFISYCGGLPAPENSENPLRYKFSWSPRGVLFNVLQSSRYLMEGKRVDVAEGGQLLDIAEKLNFLPGFNIEGFPNRDSEIYREIYGIKDAHSILRGTIRYEGFCHAMKAILRMGLLDPNPHASLHPGGPDITWKGFLCEQLGQSSDKLYDSIKSQIYEFVGKDSTQLECIEQLGLMEDVLIDKRGNPLDTLSNYLAKRLDYRGSERDLIIMRHDIGIEWPDRTTEKRAVDLVVYGQPHGYSAMAATVGYPTGIATKMVLEGEIQEKGLLVPLTSDIYRPILKRLKKENIEAVETIIH